MSTAPSTLPLALSFFTRPARPVTSGPPPEQGVYDPEQQITVGADGAPLASHAGVNTTMSSVATLAGSESVDSDTLAGTWW
ncbi:putative ATP-grasp-modified RiPP [Streptomyces sp. NPDC056244]|uniref:putative ATP-grasp-modified RiPP n=1 Tax=Streptomyces sp. NPDC056244 TaxID=3345762 RepID=UPI0035DC6152